MPRKARPVAAEPVPQPLLPTTPPRGRTRLKGLAGVQYQAQKMIEEKIHRIEAKILDLQNQKEELEQALAESE